MSIDLKNRGLASAEDIAIHFIPIDQHCETWCNTNRWSREPRDDGFYFRSHTTIHPDETLQWLSNCTSNIRNWKEEGKMLMFRLRIFARNTPARSFVLSYSAAELTAQPNVPIKREAVDEA
jgi:hypothetical protein